MKFGVIGTGIIGRIRVASIAARADAEVTAVADPDLDAARSLAGPLGAEAFADHGALLARGDLDVVVVSSPVTSHEEITLAALRAGCHVLCEKPLANSVEACRRLVAAAKDADRCLAVGFNHRFYPSMRYLKSVLDEERIGRLDHLRVFGGHDGLANFREDWMYRSDLSGGGAMMDVGLHLTDLVRYLLGEITEVYAVAGERVWEQSGSEDNALAIFKTEVGVPVRYQATWNEWKGYRIEIEAYGDRGMAGARYAPMFNQLITQDRPGGPRRREQRRYPKIVLREKLRGWQSTTRITFDDELDELMLMLSGEPSRLATGDDGLRAVEIAAAARRSSVEARPVETEPR